MKIKTAGNTYTITSSLKASDITMAMKYEPDSLCAKSENGDVKFSINYQEGKPFIKSGIGLTYGNTALDGGGKAQATFPIPAEATSDNIKSILAEVLSPIKPIVDEIERKAAANLDKIIEAQKALIENIEIG